MSNDKDDMAAEMISLTSETEQLVCTCIEIAGWSCVIGILEQIAEHRGDGRLAGVLLAVQRFLVAGGN